MKGLINGRMMPKDTKFVFDVADYYRLGELVLNSSTIYRSEKVARKNAGRFGFYNKLNLDSKGRVACIEKITLDEKALSMAIKGDV